MENYQDINNFEEYKEKLEEQTPDYKWECFIDNKWTHYLPEDNKIINNHYMTNKDQLLKTVLSFSKFKENYYCFDFQRMIQINFHTKVERPIRCLGLVSPASISIPCQWECLVDHKWSPYESSDNYIIDSHFKKSPNELLKTKTSYSGKDEMIDYIFDFKNMVQINSKTLFKRPIRCLELIVDNSQVRFECSMEGKWVEYNEVDNKLLSLHYKNNPNITLTTQMSFSLNTLYLFDFQRLYQKNQTTGFKRKIRCIQTNPHQYLEN